MIQRRDLLKSAAFLPLVPRWKGLADDSNTRHLWEGFDFGSIFPARERLDQGPFDIG